MSWLLVPHLWHQYWAWAGGNIGAMPLQALIGVVVTFVFRGPIGRLFNGEAIKEAKAARRIAADLHERLTGEPHPDAPGQPRTDPDAKSESEVA